MDEALTQLQAAVEAATLPATIKAAIVKATPFNTPEHPQIQAAIEKALNRLALATREAQLTDMSEEGPLPVDRQSSSDKRERLMLEMRLKRNLGVPIGKTADAMRHMCYDTYCKTCATESPKYQAICVNFMLECLAVRVSERLMFDRLNGYRRLVPADLTNAMRRYVADPVRFWLHETALFYSLGDRLVHLFENVIKPNAAGQSTHKKAEARKFGAHAGSIQHVISNIRKCDASEREAAAVPVAADDAAAGPSSGPVVPEPA